MAIEHLDTLYNELPELFQIREPSADWNDDLIIIPIENPERIDDRDGQISRQPVSEGVPDLETFGEDLVDPEAPAPELSVLIGEIFGGTYGGAPSRHKPESPYSPPPDSLAFYLPFHYYYPRLWGVYLLLDGVIWLAGDLIRRSHGAVSARKAIQAARLFLYYHEAFHHKTECFSTRLELTHRQPFYKTGFERLYQKTFGTIYCLEEGLSNASALQDSNKLLRDAIVYDALVGYVNSSPPGYDQGVKILNDFHKIRCQFAENNQHGCLPHLPIKNPELWRAAPYMFNGISNIKSRVNYVIPRNSPLAARLPFRPRLI